jgi:chemotaxis protein methyltransferase CheR
MSNRPSASTFDIEVRLLLEAIFLRFHYDFRSYSMASLRRRITAAISALGCATVSALQEKILHEPEVFTKLLQYLTVQVSDMFRDPPFFRVFRQRIVPELATYPSPRIWVAGASSGEEVYTLAIVLAEEGLLERTLIYATDINPHALEKAEAGVYPLDRVPAFEANHREAGGKGAFDRWYTSAYGHAVFDRKLRERVVFSDHSLATDSVFAEVQVVTCRNVLIYFDRTLQDRAVDLFRDALSRRGFLGLGSMESLQLSAHVRSFEPFAQEERWYRRL